MIRKERTCLICNYSFINEVTEYQELKRVTSDSKIWVSDGKIGQCSQCNAIQKIYDETLISEINNIYENYEIYFQGKGQEQKIFINDMAQPRSKMLVQYFVDVFH